MDLTKTTNYIFLNVFPSQDHYRSEANFNSVSMYHDFGGWGCRGHETQSNIKVWPRRWAAREERLVTGPDTALVA